MYTNGIELVLRTIDPGARPAGRVAFPTGLVEGGARRSSGEPARTWLKRCVDEGFGGDIRRIAVEENLALFLVISWRQRAIEYANLQALWVDVPLSRFVGGAPCGHRYLRVDYDPSALGPLLKEPLPHVHVEGEGEPRFPVPSSAGDDLVGWFIDFVYRNFFYSDWIVWAEVAWDSWCRQHARENRWLRLVDAFAQSAVRIIEADQDALRDLERAAQRREGYDVQRQKNPPSPCQPPGTLERRCSSSLYKH